MEKASNNRIMTIEELSDFLKLSVRTVYQMVTEGTIPGRKIGKQWRFDREKILAWFNNSGDDLAAAHPAPRPRRATTARRILVVEDDPGILEMFAGVFREEFADAVVVTAANGLDALVEIGRARPDIIVCDITIPRVDGFELCRILKNDPDLSSIVFIAVSGTPEKEFETDVKQCGADGYLRKPLSPDALAAYVGRYMHALQGSNSIPAGDLQPAAAQRDGAESSDA